MLTPRLDKLDRNFLLNGGFDFSQEFGTGTVVLTATPTYIVDQFLASYASTYNTVPSVQRTEASPNSRTKYALRFFNMNALASTASIISSQRIESIFAKDLVGEACSVSVSIRSQEHQRVQVEIYTANVEDDFSAVTLAHSTSVVLTPDFNWSEIKFENFAMPSGSSRGVEVRVILDDVASTGVVFEAQVAQIKLSVGRKAQAFSYSSRDVVEELSRCQRYFETSYDKDIALGSASQIQSSKQSIALSGTDFYDVMNQDFKIQKRGIPALNFYNPSTGAINTFYNINTTASVGSAQVRAGSLGDSRFSISSTSGLTANQVFAIHWAADARL